METEEGGNFLIAARHLNIHNEGTSRDGESITQAVNELLTVISDPQHVKMFQNMALFSVKFLAMSLSALEAIGTTTVLDVYMNCLYSVKFLVMK